MRSLTSVAYCGDREAITVVSLSPLLLAVSITNNERKKKRKKRVKKAHYHNNNNVPNMCLLIVSITKTRMCRTSACYPRPRLQVESDRRTTVMS